MINSQYLKKKGQAAILEVEIDGVYKKLLLLKKKKYAGLMVTNYLDSTKKDFVEKLEMQYKGLDLVRRDWSNLTKEVSAKVLDVMMSEGGIDFVSTYLEKVNEALDNFDFKKSSSDEEIPLNINHFKIQKQLQKKTSAYVEQGLPHIKVALDMKRLFEKSDNELVGHYIPFLIIESQGSGGLSEKAVHPIEFIRS